MADAFTPVLNSILEVLAGNGLSSYEMRTLLFLIRMTWGWHKESDTIALRQFSNATGIDRRNTHRTVCKLEIRRIIVIHRDDRKAATYRINKNLSEWHLSSVETTRPKRPARRLTIIRRDDSMPSTETPNLSSVETTALSSEETSSKEILNKRKERTKESALSPLSLGGETGGAFTDIRPDLKNKQAQKEQSAQRNKMGASSLYSIDDLIGFKDKSLEELQQIHRNRLGEKLEKKARESL